jgi:hypothetical protein
MVDEPRSNAFFRGGGWRRYVQLAVLAVITLAVVGLLAAVVHAVFAVMNPPSPARYVSLVNHGQVQVCRVTPGRVICPPLSGSLSKSFSTSTSLSPSVHTQ